MSKFQKTKKYLNQINKIDRRISVKLLEAEKHRMLAMNISNSIKPDVVQTSKQNTFENAMIAACSAEEEANRLVEAMYRKRQEIEKMIDNLEDDEARDVLTVRFMCKKSFDEMGDILHMSRSAMFRAYDRGLQEFEDKYGVLYL